MRDVEDEREWSDDRGLKRARIGLVTLFLLFDGLFVSEKVEYGNYSGHHRGTARIGSG